MTDAEKMENLTLDEWVEERADVLAKDIACHILNLGGLSSSSEESDLLRAIMISIRQWDAKRDENHSPKVMALIKCLGDIAPSWLPEGIRADRRKVLAAFNEVKK